LRMVLSSIVVSRDLHGISVLESVLGSLHIQVETAPELASARAMMTKSKIDALIVDSEIEGCSSLFHEIGNTAAEALVPLLICNSNGQIDAARQAEFLFRKPISVPQAVRTLSSARNMIVERRLRYHRQTVDIATSLVGGRHKFDARILNLSQGGAGLAGDFSQDLPQQVELHFSLPKTRQSLKLEGEIVWTKQQARAGVQFKDVSNPIHRQLQIWLEQRFFSR
jgi:PilZ domain